MRRQVVLLALCACASGREYFLKLNVKDVKVTARADTEEINGVYNELMVWASVDDLVREQRPTFRPIAPGGTFAADWTSNIIDKVVPGNTIKFLVLDYKAPDDKRDPSECISSTNIDCSDTFDRELVCFEYFGANGMEGTCNPLEKTWHQLDTFDPDAGFNTVCDFTSRRATSINDAGTEIGYTSTGVTWAQCMASTTSCNTVKNYGSGPRFSDGSLVAGGPWNTCRVNRYQVVGYAKYTLPPMEKDWEVTDFGDRTQWSATLPKVSSTNNILGRSGNAGRLTFRIKFWASSCDAGEYITSEGFCEACPAGAECDGVSQTTCAKGHFATGSAGTCSTCAAGRHQPFKGQATCAQCSPGTWSGPGAEVCQSCTAGYYGVGSLLATTAQCDGECPAGHFCPTGSKDPTANPCGGASKFCPARSASPRSVQTGHYSTGGSDATTRVSEARCEAGSSCSEGKKTACPADTWSGAGKSACTQCTQCSKNSFNSGCGGSDSGRCTECRWAEGEPITGDDCISGIPRYCTGLLYRGNDTSGCASCTECPEEYYVTGCASGSNGTCTKCGACEDGLVRVGCGGLSPGSCVDERSAIQQAAASVGMSVDAFITFVTILSLVAASGIGFVTLYMHRRRVQAKKEAEAFKAKNTELIDMQKAAENMSVNPVFASQRQVVKAPPPDADATELRDGFNRLQEENELLRAELKRLKVDAQKSSTTLAVFDMKRWSRKKKEFGSRLPTEEV